MRVCRSCGRENPDESDFCSCGEYLRWEPTGQVRAIPPVGSGRAALADRREAASQAGPAEGAGIVEVQEAVDPNVTRAPIAAPGRAEGRGDGSAAQDRDASHGTAALTLRLGDGDGASPEVVAVEVEPGSRATILGLVRNQSDVVDNFEIGRASCRERV